MSLLEPGWQPDSPPAAPGTVPTATDPRDTPAPHFGGSPIPRPLRDACCVLGLALADIGATITSVGAATVTQNYISRWIRLNELSSLTVLDAAQLLAATVVVGFFVRGLYLRRETLWEKVRLTYVTLVLSLTFALTALYLTQVVETVPRSFALLCGLATLAIVPPARILMLLALRRFGVWNLRVALVGVPAHLGAAGEDLSSDPSLGYRVVALIDASSPVLRLPPRLDEVVVVARGLDPAELERLFSAVRRMAPTVTLIPDFGALPFGRGMTRFMFDRQRVLLTSRNLLKDPANLLVKRIFDIVVSTVLLVPGIPLLVFSALAVRLTSRGPVLFSQTRIGRNGKRFRCLKFRTMYPDAEARLEKILASDPRNREEWERFQKLKDDPRVTRIGGILRRTSLDELPQMLNVLVGSMSLVGPRPLPQYHYDKFQEPYRSDYLEVKPGITGLWQVSGRSDADIQRMALLNSWYARNWSLWLDITLLLRTLPAVLRNRGAY